MSRLLSMPGTGWMVNSVDHHGNTPLMMAAKYATRSADDGRMRMIMMMRMITCITEV